MKTKSRISHGELGIAAVDRVTGETCAVAKILPIRTTIDTFPIGPAQPGDADTIADLEFRICSFGDLFDPSDDLMSENQRQFRVGQLTIDDVKIGPANCACRNTHEQLSPARLWFWHIAQLQWPRWLVENHRAHELRQRYSVKQLNSASTGARWLGSQLSSPSFVLVMIVGAAEKRYLVEHVLLEPFKPEIND